LTSYLTASGGDLTVMATDGTASASQSFTIPADSACPPVE
jgi:hypothetical protein